MSDVPHSSSVAAQTLDADHVPHVTESDFHLVMLSVKAHAVTASIACQLDGQLAVGCNIANIQINLMLQQCLHHVHLTTPTLFSIHYFL